MTWQAAPAGYFELKRCEDDSVEVAYFGLLPEYLGRGWGKHLHTCTLDHPAALPNYMQRGFRQVQQESYTVDIPKAISRIQS